MGSQATLCASGVPSAGAHLLFVKYLHGIVVPGLLVFDEHHAPKGASAKGLDAFKVIQLGRVLGSKG